MAKKKLTQRKKDEETEQEDTVEDKPLEEAEQESEQKSTEGTAADEISSEESDETEQNEPASTRTFTSVPKRVTSPVLDDVNGRIVEGQFVQIAIRQRTGKQIELGDLLVVDQTEGYLILEVFDLAYSSQIPGKSQELMAGLKLEGYGEELSTFENELRNYVIVYAKTLVNVKREANGQLNPISPKILPQFFRETRLIDPKDLTFLTTPPNPIYMGKLRSGSKILPLDIFVNGADVIPHHVLICATTGRGKSNLMKMILWSLIPMVRGKFGILVLDPHNEYYKGTKVGLQNHPDAAQNVVFYTPNPSHGQSQLCFNIQTLTPGELHGILTLSEAQSQAITSFFQRNPGDWINDLMTTIDEDGCPHGVKIGTVVVLQRMFRTELGIIYDPNSATYSFTKHVFTAGAGCMNTIKEITAHLEAGKIVVVDTSMLTETLELLVGSMIAQTILNNYREYKFNGTIDDKPVIGVVLEEAPRVLSSDVLHHGDNIYSTIAKEGRKFKVGLIAITQLVSVIPKPILANINTKIILGNENKSERSAIIDSACQDLTSDDHMIASLDKGEAIVSSNFTRFAVPVKFDLFEDFALKEINAKRPTTKDGKPIKMAFDE